MQYNTAIKPLFQTDCYKVSHRQQYAAIGDITRVYSNYTHRKSRVDGVDEVVHFGLQAAVQRYLMDEWIPFFNADPDQVCVAYEARLAQVLGPNNVGSEHIRALHALGHLPLKICALPEGTRVPIGVPSWTIENTDDRFAWVTNYVETVLSSATWLACTSATTSAQYRTLLTDAARKTGAPAAAIDWQAHDFSFRGMSSPESAAVSGAAHLLSFNGSDSLCAMDWIERYYGGSYVCGSVAATEHSVQSAGIAMHGEHETYRRLLEAYPSGFLSIVSDTYDLWNVMTNILPSLKDQIEARDGRIICRPDSGSPELILCGDPSAPMNSPAWWGVVRLLHQTFGATKNSKGYFELNPKVGAIYGDSITIDRARAITRNLKKLGYASTNVVFGVGSYSFQYVTRDTYGSAIKATWAEINGTSVNLKKDPVTDDGTKRSATGRLAVTPTFELIQCATPEQEVVSLLQPIWCDGAFVRRDTFDTIVSRVRA
jgi:nicotinic acid phosphoribosyltransferase